MTDDDTPADSHVPTGDSPGDKRRRRFRWRRQLPVLWLLAILCGYGLYQLAVMPRVYFEPDPNAYLYMAKRMATGQSMGLRPTDPYLFQDHMWVENAAGDVLPKYNPGYPFFLAIAYRLGGDNAMLYTSAVLGTLALVAVWLLARQWMRPMAAGFATAAMAFNQMYLFYSGYTLTHSANICCATWGFYGLWRWRRHGGWWPAILGGLGLAMAVSVRYTSLLMLAALPCLVIARLLTLRTRGVVPAARRRFWLELLAMTAAVGLVFGALAWYHERWFGSILLTGYSFSDEQQAFSLEGLLRTWQHLLVGISTELGFLIVPLGLVGIFGVGRLWDRLARFAWIAPLFICYAAYYWVVNGQAYFRFMLVTFPLFALSAFMLLDRIPRQRLLGRLLPMCLVLLLAVGWRADRALGALEPQPRSMRGLSWRVAQELDRQLPNNATLFINPPLQDYLATRADFRAYDLTLFSHRANPYPSGRGAPRSQMLRRLRFEQFLAREAAGWDDLRARVSQAEAEGRVAAIVAPAHLARQLQSRIGRDWRLTERARLPTFTPAEHEATDQELPDSEWVILQLKPPAPAD